MKSDRLLGGVSVAIGALMLALYVMNSALVLMVGACIFGGGGLILLIVGRADRRLPYSYPIPESIARSIVLDRLLALAGAGVGGYLAAKHENYWYMVAGISFGALAGHISCIAIGRVRILRMVSLQVVSRLEERANAIVVILSVLMALSAGIGFALHGGVQLLIAVAFFLLCGVVLLVARSR